MIPEKKEKKGRTLAIDYGHARIGLALSDSLAMIALPLENIPGDKKPQRAAKTIHREIERLEQEKQCLIDTIVIGLPLHLNGTESPRSLEVKILLEELKKLQPTKTILLFDERFTTLQADRAMKEMGNLTRKQRAGKVDSVSSIILLQSYLDNLSLKKNDVK